MQKEKDLRAALTKAGEEFKYQPKEVKEKARGLYKLAMQAVERCEGLRAELATYKAPTLYDKSKSHEIPQRTYLSRIERIKHYKATDPTGDAYRAFLKWNNLTYEQADQMAQTGIDPRDKSSIEESVT